jgi:protein TonB
MELKKNPNADLNKKAGLYRNIGFVLSLAIVLFAFEYKSYDDTGVKNLGQVADDFEDLMEIPPTEQPPPPPQEIEVDLDVDMTEETVIEEIVFEEAPEEEEADEIFTIVEDQPGFPGGMGAFYQFVSKNLKYPNQARRMGIEGKVFVQFVVDRDGTITEVASIKGIGAGCDEEAVRVIKSSPKWSAGKQRGKAVKVRMILPITFKLGG